jgi:hypothetical protein
MKMYRKQPILLSVIVLMGLQRLPAVSAFSPPINTRKSRHSGALPSSFAADGSDDPSSSSQQPSLPNNNDDNVVASIISSPKVTAHELRQISVTNAKGESVMLGDTMSENGTSIVVFLRHLGCFNCWSYARDWALLQEELAKLNENNAKITGPIFISIGDEERLNAFLDKNPDIPRSQMLVDGYDFTAYRQAGFGRFDEKPVSVTDGVKPKPITLGGIKGWWTFLSSFMPLAPVTPEMQFPEMLTPPGLFWVGGTMVIRGDDIVYRWDDRISGDHPDASQVLAIAKDAAMQPKSS